MSKKKKKKNKTKLKSFKTEKVNYNKVKHAISVDQCRIILDKVVLQKWKC